MTNIQEVKAAQKRCLKMGKFHSWRPEFNDHKLAAVMDNYTYVIDVEMEESIAANKMPFGEFVDSYQRQDYFSILQWFLAMSKSINEYCDESMVSGNDAAEYWLERFLWRCDLVCDWSKLN